MFQWNYVPVGLHGIGKTHIVLLHRLRWGLLQNNLLTLTITKIIKVPLVGPKVRMIPRNRICVVLRLFPSSLSYRSIARYL